MDMAVTRWDSKKYDWLNTRLKQMQVICSQLQIIPRSRRKFRSFISSLQHQTKAKEIRPNSSRKLSSGNHPTQKSSGTTLLSSRSQEKSKEHEIEWPCRWTSGTHRDGNQRSNERMYDQRGENAEETMDLNQNTSIDRRKAQRKANETYIHEPRSKIPRTLQYSQEIG